MPSVSPGGTPLQVLNQDLATVDAITSAGSNQATATPVVRFGQISIYQVTRGGAGTGVVLPDDAEVGDVVELYVVNGTFNVYPQSGGQITNHGTDTAISMGGNGGYFRFLGSGQWGCVLSA